MTPQEKAKELFHKFYLVNSESVELQTGEYDLVFSLDARDAKQCALIAVDEIVKEIQCNEFDFQSNVPMSVYTYWKNVKQEIEQL